MSITKIAPLVVAGIVMSSCSVIMAANQPGRRELGVFIEGTPQSLVRAELGSPVWSGKDDQGLNIDIFQFVQGYSGGARAARFVCIPPQICLAPVYGRSSGSRLSPTTAEPR